MSDESTSDTSGVDDEPLKTEPHDLVPVRDEVVMELDRARVWQGLFGAPAPTIGRFTVLTRIGSGGMGDVYAAYDELLDRKVAIKLVRSAAPGGSSDQKRLLREAQTMARVRHDNVAQVHEAGEYRDRVFIAMEFVRGPNLRTWLADEARRHAGQPYQRAVLDLFIEAGHGLQAAHDAALVHRDFKPENVLIDEDGRPRVVDFGLARALASAPDAGAGVSRQSMSPGRLLAPSVAISARQGQVATRRSEIAGTPLYMAPEQLRGEPVDARADQYSFCVALYEALYQADPDQARAAGQRQDVPRTHGRDVAPVIRDALLRGLSSDPDARFADMSALLRELRAWPRRPRRQRLVLAAAVLALSTAGVLYLYGDTHTADPCDNVGQEMARLWNPEIETAIARAFRATGEPDTETLWRGIARDIDAYVKEWDATQASICRKALARDTHLHDFAIRGFRCLDYGKTRLDALLKGMQEADRAVVAGASEAIATLPALSPCADLELLQDELAPPDRDEEQAVDDIHKALEHAHVRERFGDYKEALEVARNQLTAAQKLRYKAAQARALYYVGRFTVHGDTADDFVRGQRDMQRASRLAEGERALLLKADIRVSLMRLAARSRLPIAIAREWSEDALAASNAIGNLPNIKAEILRHRGVAERHGGDLERAEQLQNEGLEILAAAPRTPAVVRARHLQDLGNTLKARRRYDEAEELYRRALDDARPKLGEYDPVVVDLFFDMATLDINRGRFPEARRMLVQTLERHRQKLGSNHPHVGRALLELADLDRRDGELTRGLQRAEEGMRIYRAAYPSAHRKLAFAHTRLASLALRRGDYQEAVNSFQVVLDIEIDHHGTDSGQATAARLNVAEALLGLERHGDALAMVVSASRGLAIEPGDPVLTSFAAALRGRALLGRGDTAQARVHLERAVSQLESKGMQYEWADAAWALARLLAPTGQDADERAQALAEAALSRYREQSAEVATPEDDIEDWLSVARQR